MADRTDIKSCIPFGLAVEYWYMLIYYLNSACEEGYDVACLLAQVFHRLVHQDKQDNQGSNHVFGMGHSISIMIRRSHLYEDAFEKLSSENGRCLICFVHLYIHMLCL